MKISPQYNIVAALTILYLSFNPLHSEAFTYNRSLNPIKSGFGADGSFDVIHDSIKNQSSPGLYIHLFRPSALPENATFPVLFFLHGIGAGKPEHYIELLYHCASRGNAVLYASYPQTPAMIRPEIVYNILRKGFNQGALHWRSLLDSTRIGIIGHSYGGGAVPATAWEWLIKKRWGAKGSFLYVMAPWYSFEITPQQLSGFPSGTAMIMQIFEDDNINDHRMAKDIFDNISIDESRKNFIVLHSDTSEQPYLLADHSVPSGKLSGSDSKLDNMDFSGVWRHLDALEAFSFDNDSSAYKIALGSGSDVQRSMGQHPSGKPVKECTATHSSFILNPQNAYLNFWNHSMNPRKQFGSSLEMTLSRRERRQTTLKNYLSAVRKEKVQVSESKQASVATTVHPSPVTEGFGKTGPYTVVKRSFPHPAMGDGKIYIFSPESVVTACPAIVFLHGFPWPVPDFYNGLITHISSQGYHVIFPSYIYFDLALKMKHDKLYQLMIEGADEALHLLGNMIDSTRIGIIGHNYGGGAVPAVAWHYFKLREWGKNGRFMFIMSPWYSFNIDRNVFNYFPSDVNMVLQVYESDRFIDWRMAEDLFYSFKKIPLDRKEFITVMNDHYKGKMLNANHAAPLSGNNDDIDNIDYYGIYKMVDALATYSFNNDSSGYVTALQNGSHEQTWMGTWPDGTPVTPLKVTDRPVTPYNDRSFFFSWNRPWNKRRHYYTPVEKAKPAWLYKLQEKP